VILWVDESGFYLLPAAVRTYAPRGRTPVLRVPLSRDHLSVISGLSPDGRLVLMAQERALTGADVARFLRHLLEIIPDPLLIIWDGGPIHRAQPVRDLLAEVGPGRLRVEPLPGYAPDLNPDEGSGPICSTSNCATSAATAWRSSATPCAKRPSACAPSPRSFAAASAKPATMFSSPRWGQ